MLYKMTVVPERSAAYFADVFTLTTVAARRQFSNLVSRVWFTKERATLTRYGRAIVAIVPIEDLAQLERQAPARPKRPKKRAARRPRN